MGQPKHRLIHQESGSTLLERQLQRLSPHFEEVKLLVGQKQLIDDRTPGQLLDPQPFGGQGPLAGLLSACRATSYEFVALLACDYPAVTSDVFRAAVGLMSPVDKVLVFADKDGRAQWLCGIYRADLASDIEKFLRSGGRAVKEFAKHLGVDSKPLPENLAPAQFTNLNTLDEARDAGYVSAW